MVLAYFKSHEDLQAFAHGKQHREIWDWWNALVKKDKVGHLCIAHEVFCAPSVLPFPIPFPFPRDSSRRTRFEI